MSLLSTKSGAALVVLLVLLGGCQTLSLAPSVIPTATGSKGPQAGTVDHRRHVYVTVHADTAFIPSERADLDMAVGFWATQTDHVVEIRIVYDLSFESVTDLQDHVLAGHHLLTRLESDSRAVVAADGGQCGPSGGCVLGWCTNGGIHNAQGEPVHMAFVSDRMTDSNMRLQAMMHELGHLLGLAHIADKRGVMYPSVRYGRSACLSHEDLEEFCRVNSCTGAQPYSCAKE